MKLGCFAVERCDREMVAGRVKPAVDGTVPVIEPVAGTVVARPFWSVMIPTYNCGEYLRQTLASVLAQDPGPQRMQIEVVDDCSTKDDPQALVREIGGGRVSFFRQPGNVGCTANFNTCVERSRGEVVHILHADDYVGPGFYEAMRRGLERYPQAGAGLGGTVHVLEESKTMKERPLEQADEGLLEGFIRKLAVESCVCFASVVVRRSTYETLGGFDMRLVHAADWDMWKRIAATSPFYFTPQARGYYRLHSQADTPRLHRTGKNIQDCRLAIEIAQDYLPVDLRKKLTHEAKVKLAMQAACSARRYLKKGDRQTCRAQLREAWRTSRSPRVWRAMLRVGVRLAALRRAGDV